MLPKRTLRQRVIQHFANPSSDLSASLLRLRQRMCEVVPFWNAWVSSLSTVVTHSCISLRGKSGRMAQGGNVPSLQPEKTRRVIDGYQRAILIHCKPGVDAKGLVATLEREVFLAGYYKAALAPGCGPCRLCENCTFDSCLHPDRARPSMEACGVDVFATARANGFRIEVVTDRCCDQDDYGVALVD